MFDLGAIDLGCSRNKFTWTKGRWGNAAIKERLDRGLASILETSLPECIYSTLRGFKLKSLASPFRHKSR